MACLICKGERDGDELIEVSRGLQTLVKYSFLREDGLAEIFRNVQSVIMHKKCRKKYVKCKITRSGVRKPCSLKVRPPEKRSDVNFVFTALPDDAKNTVESESHSHFVTDPINRNNPIKVEHSIIGNYLSESVGQHQENAMQMPRDINLYDVKNSKLKYLPTENDGTVLCNLDYLKPKETIDNHEDTETQNYDDPKKPFPFQHLCFICAKDIIDKNIPSNSKKAQDKKNPLYSRVLKESTKVSLLKKLKQHPSPENDVIIRRIKDVNLVTVKAGYHTKCFYLKRLPSTGNRRGRPLDSRVSNAMATIFRYIEEDSQPSYTIAELLDLLGNSVKLDSRTVISRLEERFRGKIFFTASSGLPTVITIIRDSSTNVSAGIRKAAKIKKIKKSKVVKEKRKKAKKDNNNHSDTYDDCSYVDPLSPGIAASTDTPSHAKTYCHVCWSANRRLGGLADCADVYRRICGDFYMMDPNEVLLCWECRALLKHALCFQKRALMSQQILNFQIQRTSLSSISANFPASSMISYNPNKPTNAGNSIKTELAEPATKAFSEEIAVYPEYTRTNTDGTKPPGVNKPQLDVVKQHVDVIKPFSEGSFANQSDEKWEIPIFHAFDDDGVDNDDDMPLAHSIWSTGNENVSVKNSDKVKKSEKVKKSVTSSKSNSSKKKTKKPLKIKKKLNISTATRYCRVKTLEFNSIERIEQVPIQPHEMAEWRERERESTYFKSLAQKCDTCITAVDADHDRLYHSKDNNYVCVVCSVTCFSKAQLDSHLAGHYSLFRCSICQYQCYDRRHATTHVEMHRRVYQCVECGHEFRSLDMFKEHYSELHRIVICDCCGKQFGHKIYLEKHIQRNHIEQICTICNTKYKRYNHLQRHIETKHLVSRTENAYCVQCDIQFNNEKLLKRHLYQSVKHAPESRRDTKPKQKKQYKCPACPNIYASTHTLKGHYDLEHAKNIKFHCKLCDKPFPRKSNYIAHMKRHEGIRPPKNKICEICGRGFRENKTLIHHVRTHTGERPFACAYCGSRFAQRTALGAHVRHVHEKAPRTTAATPHFLANRGRHFSPPRE